MPSLPWHLPHVDGTFSGYTADRASAFGKIECGSPWQLVHGWSLLSACTLPFSLASWSLWQVAQLTLAGLSGCGYSLMSAWQSLHLNPPCTLLANFSPSTPILWPEPSVIVWSAWQARQSVCDCNRGACASNKTADPINTAIRTARWSILRAFAVRLWRFAVRRVSEGLARFLASKTKQQQFAASAILPSSFPGAPVYVAHGLRLVPCASAEGDLQLRADSFSILHISDSHHIRTVIVNISSAYERDRGHNLVQVLNKSSAILRRRSLRLDLDRACPESDIGRRFRTNWLVLRNECLDPKR